MHQDQWHEQYGGEGVPDWAAKRPMPYCADPVRCRCRSRRATGPPRSRPSSTTSGPTRTTCSTGWAAAWRLVAQHYRDQPYSMGYDLLNEPWAGHRVAELPDDRLPVVVRLRAAAGDDARARTRSARSTARTSSGGSRSSSPAARSSTTYYTPVAGEKQPRLLLAQLLPRRVLREPGHPGQQHRQLPGLHRQPREPRDRPGRAHGRRRADDRVGCHRQRQRASASTPTAPTSS